MEKEQEKPRNPPAFPNVNTHERSGMTLRDYFAAKAMIYFIEANNGNFSDNDASQIYYIADTMLKQREL